MLPSEPEKLRQYLSSKRNLEAADLRNASLSGLSLDHAKLRGADLRGADLSHASLVSADLTDARLDQADLGHACLVGATAERADFSRVRAIGTDFAMSSLVGAGFAGAILERANFTEADLREADFTGAELTNTVFAHSNLLDAKMAAAFVGTIFVAVDLSHVRLLKNAECTSLYVDQRTIDHLVEAHHAGVSVLDVLAALHHGEVPLPPVLKEIAEALEAPAGDHDNLMPEFAAPLHVGELERDLLRRTLQEAETERPLQVFLEEHPAMLVAPLVVNHRGWVVPQKRLGDQFVCDFMVGGLTSLGHEWLAVELESPSALLFTQGGDVSQALNHAIRQILDWRNFIKNNLHACRNPRAVNGLGLRDIEPDCPGLILIGRRALMDAKTKQLRSSLGRSHNIRIHTYDYLLDAAAGRTPLVRGLPSGTAMPDV